jgi:hypothetical protein
MRHSLVKQILSNFLKLQLPHNLLLHQPHLLLHSSQRQQQQQQQLSHLVQEQQML